MKTSKRAVLFFIYMTIMFGGMFWANITLNDMLSERNQQILINK